MPFCPPFSEKSLLIMCLASLRVPPPCEDLVHLQSQHLCARLLMTLAVKGSKSGSKLGQSAHPMSYSEAKSILRHNFRTECRQRLDIGTEEDSIHQPDRAAQVTIFRLGTGRCQLLSLLHRLKTSHSDECSCCTGLQTPNHILQSWRTFDALRRHTWLSQVKLKPKLKTVFSWFCCCCCCCCCCFLLVCLFFWWWWLGV